MELCFGFLSVGQFTVYRADYINLNRFCQSVGLFLKNCEISVGLMQKIEVKATLVL